MLLATLRFGAKSLGPLTRFVSHPFSAFSKFLVDLLEPNSRRTLFSMCVLAVWGIGNLAFAQTKIATSTSLTVTSGGTAVTSAPSGTVITLTASVRSGSTTLTTGQVNFCDATATRCTDIHLLGTAQLTSAGIAVLKLRPGV
jgi:hypothetical protein